MECRPICHLLLLLLLLCILIKDVGVAKFSRLISPLACVLARAMKLLMQAFQRYILFNPFTAKDAIWRPHGITHLRICLSAHYNFYYAFQQPVH